MIGYTEYLVTQNEAHFQKACEELNQKGVHYKIKVESSGFNGVVVAGKKEKDVDHSQIYHIYLKNHKKDKDENNNS